MKQITRLYFQLFICVGLCFGLLQGYFILDNVNDFAAAASSYPLSETLGVGGFSGCVINPDGTLACWGYMNDWWPPIPVVTFSQITAGDGFYCGITSLGVLDCWGDSAYGVIDVIPTGTFKQVSSGLSHSCAVRSNGTVACWGDNLFGQSTPLSGSFSQVAVHGYYSCGIRGNGAIVCWGGDDYEEDWGILNPPEGTFLQISAGLTHLCGLKTDGTLACWGHDQAGSTTPPTGTFTRLNAGWKHTCAIRTDGTVACWGYDSNGSTSPPTGTFIQVGCGWYHSCGLRDNGSIECWGRDDYGQSSPSTGNFGPAQVAAGYYHTCSILINGELGCWGTDVSGVGVLDAPTGTFKQISTNYKANCGLRSDGTLACWGENQFLQATSPTTGIFRQVTIGAYHACAIQHDGTITCWGDLTDNKTNPPVGTFKHISAGVHHTCGLQSNGEVACWGDNFAGQIIPLDGLFIQISSGSVHTCGLRENGVIQCWGNNDYGQAPESTDPIYIQVVAGWEQTCAIRGDLQVDCWGKNTDGQATPPSGRFIQLSASQFHTCGVNTDGYYICWGNNEQGQFPPNPPAFTSSPNTSATQGMAYSYTITAVDPDVDETLEITFDDILPTWLELNDQGEGSAILAGTPTNADVGSHLITLVVTDSSGMADTQSFTIVVANVNDPPYFNSYPEITTVDEGAPYEYLITATDPDLDCGDSITITTPTLPSWLTFEYHGSGSATLSGTPQRADVGEHDVVLRVTDSFGLYTAQPFTITVVGTTEPPLITSDDAVTLTAGDMGVAFEVTAAGEPSPVITLDETASDDLPEVLVFISGTGTATLSGDLAPETGGIYHLVFVASNGIDPDATQEFTLIVATEVVVDGTEEEISSSSGDILITIPEGTVSGEATFTLVPQTEPSQDTGSFNFAGISFTLTAESGGSEITTFDPPLIITITYDLESLGEIDPMTLMLYKWDGGAWVDANCAVAGYDRGDPALGEYWFSLEICHLCEFAVLGEESSGFSIFLPLILR